MDQTLVAFPILPGKTEAARAMLREMDGPRKPHATASDQALGVAREVWGIQQSPRGDLLLGYLAGEDLDRAFTQFAASQDEFDRWFKQQMQEVTGVDMNLPSTEPRNEIIVTYEA